ncbi:MAG: TolC family protein [Spirochaetaceae bacterium]|nr:MAG: TolC family protein [Spirochaetaceae bacterium]
MRCPVKLGVRLPLSCPGKSPAKLWLIGLIGGLLFVAAASGLGALTLEEALDTALRNNIGIELDRIELERRLRAQQSSHNRFHPSLSAGSQLSRDIYSDSDDPWATQFSLSSNLSLSVESVRRGRLTAMQYQAGELNYESAQAALVRDVSNAFFGLLLEAERIRIRREAVAAARERFELAEAEFEAGRISRYDLLSQRVAYENQRPELAQLEDSYYLARRDFTLLIGLSPGDPVVPRGDIGSPVPVSTEAEFWSGYLERRPDIVRARLQIEERRLGRSLAANEFLPTLSLNASVSRSNTTPFTEPWFGEDESPWDKRGSFGIGLSVPLGTLLPNSQRRIALEDADRRVQEAELQYQRAVLRAENDIEAALRRLRRAESSLELLDLNTELAEEAYRLAETSFEQGQIDALELRNARLELERAQLAALEERYRGRIALIELEYAVGTGVE